MATKLHLGGGNYLYYEGGKAVKYKGHPVYRWGSSNTRWSACGNEVKEFKGKTILDLEKILGWFEFYFFLEGLLSPLFFVFNKKIC